MIGIAFGLTPDDDGFGDLKEEFFANYEACMTERTYAFDGVAELIAQIDRSGLKWGVVTNKSARFTLPLTRMMPSGSAQTIISGDTTPHAKPHPAPLLEAARQLQLQPGRCVYVGMTSGHRCRAPAGMPTVAAAYGYLGALADTRHWKAECTPLFRRHPS